MRRSIAALVVLGAMLGAAPAGAQSPSFGGGWLPRAVGPTGSFTPTVGIVLQPRGGQIAIRFDTVLRCGRDTYTPVGRAVVPFDGHGFTARKLHWYFPIGRGHGNRVSYSWRLAGTVDGALASGSLRFTATRHTGARRVRCRKPDRRASGSPGASRARPRTGRCGCAPGSTAPTASGCARAATRGCATGAPRGCRD
jgi:hypothetical protein